MRAGAHGCSEPAKAWTSRLVTEGPSESVKPSARKRHGRRAIWNIVRLLICAVALYFVVRQVRWNDRVVLADGGESIGTIHTAAEGFVMLLPDGAELVFAENDVARSDDGQLRMEFGLRTAWRRSDKLLLLSSLLVFLPVPFFQGLRFDVLLRVQRIHIGKWEAIKLCFAGNFLNFAAPLGSTGGDVLKAYFISLHTHRKTEAITTIVLDRIVGLTTMLLLVAVIALFAPPGYPLADIRIWVLGVVTAGVVICVLYLSARMRRLVPRRLVSRLPAIDQLRRVDQAARGLASRPGAVALAMVHTAILQTAAFGAFTVAAFALGFRANFGHVPEFFAYFATGAVVQALPGPPQGFGTVELAYALLFAPYAGASMIVCLALATRLITLAVALPGLAVVASGAYKPSVRPDASGADKSADAASAR